MKKFIILLTSVFLMNAKYSGQTDCGSNQAPSPPTSIVNKPCPDLMSNYPYNFGNSTPLKTIIPLNFIYVEPIGGGDNWDTITDATSKKMVKLINNKWDTLQTPIKPLPSPYTAPFYSDAKINFVHKATYHVLDSSYYNFTDPDAIRLTVDTNAINIFYACGLHAGESVGIPSRACIISGVAGDPYAKIDMLHSGQVNLLCHELGHALGLWHTSQYLDAAGVTQSLTALNPSGTFRSHYVDDYWVEDHTQFNHNAHGGNNLMSYYWDSCRYISPKQMAFMHYMINNHPLLKNLPTSKVSPNTNCTVDHTGDSYINTNLTLSGSQLFPPGDIIIQSGAHVVLNSCLSMRENARIIIEPGAKLSILGGGVSTMESCPAQWWGIEVRSTQNAIQSLNSTNSNLPGTGVGMLELDHATLSDAHCAVYVSQDAGTYIGNNVPATGAGIVYSNNSLFLNNQYGMYFDTYFTLGGVTNNLSYSRRDSFVVNSLFKTTVGNSIPINAIRIDKANGIEIIGDYFSDTQHMTSTAISVTDADVKIVDHCASSGCTGTRVRNRFYGFRSAVDVGNSFNIVPATIDHVKIDQDGSNLGNVYGGIYVLNSLAPMVLNNDIKCVSKSSGLPYSYSLYLDNCDGYAVENNSFYADIPVNTIGAVINNSGPAGNSVYNNAFWSLNQGLWAQHQNYDPITGSGLVMNCNDFLTGTTYNIGVQGYGVSTTGVSISQGIAHVSDETQYTRNKYNPYLFSCPNNAESKFFINTPNPFMITSHGSFSLAAFQPTSQVNSSCSNSLELVNVTGIIPFNQSSKPTYCPVNYLPSFSKSDLQAKISSIRDTKNSLTIAYYQSLDGGHTQTLLDYIFTSPGTISLSQLRDTLKSKDFLSDTVLKAYFYHPSAPKTDFNEVFLLNYPVHPSVWSIVPGIGLSGAMFEDWESRQQENHLSPREDVHSQLVKAHTDLAIYGNEKIRRFLTDSTGPKYDSIISHYRLNETGMSKWNLIRTYIAANRIDDATELIDSLATSDTSNTDGCRMLRYTLRLATDESYADTLRADSSVRAFLLDRATYSLKPVKEGFSRALLKSVYGEVVSPERLHPEYSEEGGRAASNETGIKNILEEKDQIVIYPNPASLSLKVKVQNNKGPFVVQINNLEGKLLLTRTCNQDCEIQLETLINGVYLLNLYKDNHLLNTKKVVVIK